MWYQNILAITAILATLAVSAPTAEPAVSVTQHENYHHQPEDADRTQNLMKRDLCELSGRRKLEHIPGGGGNPPSQPAVFLDDTWWTLHYQGGVPLASFEGNAIEIGTQTIKGSDLNLPKDVIWTAVFDYGFLSCSVEYDGQKVEGVPGSSIPGPGSNLWWCTATFECPGGIPTWSPDA